YIDIVAASLQYIHNTSQFASIGQQNRQPQNIMLIVAIRWKLRKLADRDKQVLTAQSLSGICVVNSAQLEKNHLTFIRTYTLDFQAAIVRAKIDGLKLSKAIGDIGQRTNLQLAMNAKKGHHLPNSSPFSFL